MRWLLTEAGPQDGSDPTALTRSLHSGAGPLWLDLQDPSPADLELLQSAFGIHQLTVEDIRSGKQRPKWEEYPGYVFMVLVTPIWKRPTMTLNEQYLCLAPGWVVSVHKGASPWLVEVRKRLEADSSLMKGSASFLTYLVTESIIDAAFPALDSIDDQVDGLEDRLVTSASTSDLSQIAALKHAVTDLRRTLGAQRDSVQGLVTQSLRPEDAEASLYFRDIYDHLVRQYETVDSLRDLLSGAMDTYLSTVSNRLNGTMKTLTVMASLFLPLTFLTGFFGMNFAYQTGVAERTGIAFAGAIVLMVVSLAIQLYLFRRRHWI